MVRRTTVRRPAPAAEEPEEDDTGYDEDAESVVRPGWEGYRTTKQKSGYGAEFLRLDDSGEQTLIRFLEPGPFASFRQHWIDRSSGKRSWVCIEDDCPLCSAGDTPGFRIAFNVLVLSDGKPQNKVWEVGPRVAEQLEAKAKDKRTGPLDRADIYWAVSRTGKKSKTAYSIDPVKERDLEEDWEIAPLDEKTIKIYTNKMYEPSVIKVPTVKQLKEIAAEMMDEVFEDEDDDE